mgnify:CR=1 FL=1
MAGLDSDLQGLLGIDSAKEDGGTLVVKVVDAEHELRERPCGGGGDGNRRNEHIDDAGVRGRCC